jgi:Na+-translocating ferredoxin:NAD+ oxidoreductase RnfC subunit
MTMTLTDIQANGITGAGGASFPTHVKLQSTPEYIIVNAAECEPLLHKDMQLLEFHADIFLKGLDEAISITGAKSAIIGIKAKHKSVIKLLEPKLTANITICQLGDFYPAGDEVTLVYLTTGRVIQPGQLPISQGCVVQNVETLYNVGLEKPVVEKFLTIAGEVEAPLTIKVPIGITYGEILSKFNITTRNYIIRDGGMMMGTVTTDLNSVVTKRTGGLIILPVDHNSSVTYERYNNKQSTIRSAKSACDQCNFCTELCPRYLLGYPVRPETAMRNAMFTTEENPRVHAGNSFCCECNLCTMFSCPESLDPKGMTLIEKRTALSSKMKWEGLPVKPHPMMQYRKVPTKKLMQRLGVADYQNVGPLKDLKFNPAKVTIPLSQHIGAPAKSVVTVGQQVKKYDLIASAKGNISANVHASISGTVAMVNDKEIVIERRS